MSDTTEEKTRRQKLLQDIIALSEEAGLYDDESTTDEIIASVKQVRKELAEERAKGEQK